jgi:hypothetical protein
MAFSNGMAINSVTGPAFSFKPGKILRFNHRHPSAIIRMRALWILNGREMIFRRPTPGTLQKERVFIGQTHDVL